MQNIFEKIYRLHHWYHEETVSGPGASLLHTATIRAVLPELLASLGTNTFLDIPCGDFNWMQEIDLSPYFYCGADIVDEIVANNVANNSSQRKKFVWADITCTPLLQSDLVFCRDCLVHFSYDDIKKAVANLKKSKSAYLLTTSFPGCFNRDISTGEWRPIDLESEPFSFPPPLKLINENCTEENGRYRDKSMGLWIISDLPDY